MDQLELFAIEVPPAAYRKPAPAGPRWSAYTGARRMCDRCVQGRYEDGAGELHAVAMVRTTVVDGQPVRRFLCNGHGSLARDLDQRHRALG